MVNDDFDTLKLTLHSKQFSTQRINPMNLNAANIESEFFGMTHVLFNELINKSVDRPYANPDFAKSEAAFSKTMSEDRRRRAEFGFAPP